MALLLSEMAMNSMYLPSQKISLVYQILHFLQLPSTQAELSVLYTYPPTQKEELWTQLHKGLCGLSQNVKKLAK